MRFLKNNYFKDIFNQAALVFLAQLMPVIFSPIISRIYNESAIAEITGLISLSSILMVFSSLKLENTIVIEKDNGVAKKIVSSCFFLISLYSILILFLVILFHKPLVSIFKLDSSIYLVPLYVFLFSFLNVLNFWFVRIKKFKLKAVSKIIENIFYILISILLFYIIGNNQFGLVLGKILGILIALIILFRLSQMTFTRITVNTFKKLIYKYKEFPLYNAPSNLANVIGLQLLVVFIGLYFSKQEFGFFGLANMIIVIPISFISQSVASIFFQKITEHYQNKNFDAIKQTFYKTLILLLSIGIPAFIILFFGSEYIFSFVFGSQWIESGKIASVLSLVFLSQLVVSPLGVFLIAIEEIKLNSYWQYGRFVFIGIVIFISLEFVKLNFMDFIHYYSLAIAFVYFVYLIIMLVKLKNLKNYEV